MQKWVIDYETMVNCFILVAEEFDTGEVRTFVISETQNDSEKLFDFLDECQELRSWHLGYNMLAFDAQITEYLIRGGREHFTSLSAQDFTTEVYSFAQYIIRLKDGVFPPYPSWEFSIRVIDIYKLNHWDSNAKRTSLKWCQFGMDWGNVQEMPIKHDQHIYTEADVSMVLQYCINDVASTKAVFNREEKGEKVMINQIKLRQELGKKYNLDLLNASEPKLAREIFAYYLSKELDIDKRTLKKLRTPREFVKIKDVILPYVEFKTPEFRRVHDWFKSLVINPEDLKEDDESIFYDMYIKGVKTRYALGGLHGCTDPEAVIPGEDETIESVDVTSFYPRMAILYKWAPAHLSKEEFAKLYNMLFEERKKHPKGTSLNYVLKIILNSTYGLSKNKHSYLYDPELTFRITVNGQLLLSMLYEMVMLKIPNARPLMQNTDGLEFIIKKEHKELFDEVCHEWMDLTKLNLEFEQYKKLYIRDVNNYIGVFKNGKHKFKGAFEYENLPLHKNKSFSIIPRAVREYFINGVKPEDYIAQQDDIFLFCGAVKAKGKWRVKKIFVEDNVYTEKSLDKIVRYYVSDTGCKLIKHHPDGRTTQVEAGKWMQTDFNVYEKKDFEKYGVNFKYYLEEIYKQIDKIENNVCRDCDEQLKLF